MTSNEKLALAARMHVMLRRTTGRVTDTEWMVSNCEYASEIIRFARKYAVAENSPDLSELADRLELSLAPTRAVQHVYKKPDLIPVTHGLINYVRGLR